MMNLLIDPTLELNAARTVFKRQGRVLLPGFLQSPGAHQLAEGLAGDLPFHITMNKVDDSVANIAEVELSRAGEDFQRRLMAAVYGASATGFRYFYSQFEFDKHLQDATAIGDLSRDVWSFLQSAPFLSAIGRIIGVSDLQRTSAQASRYAPGHFLTRHDDDVQNSGRRAAFVLYLSAQWQADWGGLLQFIDRDGHVAEAYTPMFNTLALFRVPSAHSVSMVTPLAPIPRLAVSGWVH
jgi:SM-20-related protein